MTSCYLLLAETSYVVECQGGGEHHNIYDPIADVDVSTFHTIFYKTFNI